MKHLVVRTALFAAAATALAACATTPQYAARSNYTPPPPLEQEKPQYPTRAAPQGPAPQAVAPTGEDAAARPVGSVESRPLPPPGAVSSSELAQAAPASNEPPPASASSASERAGALERMPSEAAPPPPAEPAPPPMRPAYQPTPPQSVYTPPPRREVRTVPAHTVAGGRVVEGSGQFFDYEVSKGDHVDALAREYHTTRKVIVDANKLKSPYNLRPGQILKMPVGKAYIVQGGDTLAQVAKRFSVSPGELAELNHISSRSSLRAGQKLGLPPSYNDRGPTRVASVTVADSTPRSRPTPPEPTRPAYSYTPPPQPVETGQTPPPRPAYTPPPTPSYNTSGYTPASPSTARPSAPPPSRPQMIESSPPLNDNEIANAGRGRFVWPVRGEIISGFGVKGVGRRNDGLDIKAAQGTMVRAAAAGDVVYAGDQVPGFGNLVLVKHADGWVTAYAHLDKVSVQMRQSVTQGQELGQVGLSGGVTEPQLHFEVRYAPTPADKAKPVDPNLVLPK